MRRNLLFLSIIAMYLISLSGCGGGSGGAPGSKGEENTGIIITNVFVSDDGSDTQVTGREVDVASHLCDAADPASGEGLFMHREILNIGAAKLNPNVTATPFPASLERCIITYKKANEDPASPIIESMTIYPNCNILEAEPGSENECIIVLMDIERKIRWWNATLGGVHVPAEYPTHYVSSIWCEYMNNYGEAGSFQVEYDIWLADWNNCD